MIHCPNCNSIYVALIIYPDGKGEYECQQCGAVYAEIQQWQVNQECINDAYKKKASEKRSEKD